LLRHGKIIKEMPGSVASGTPYILGIQSIFFHYVVFLGTSQKALLREVKKIVVLIIDCLFQRGGGAGRAPCILSAVNGSKWSSNPTPPPSYTREKGPDIHQTVQINVGQHSNEDLFSAIPLQVPEVLTF
jgi:hypothetical protein